MSLGMEGGWESPECMYFVHAIIQRYSCRGRVFCIAYKKGYLS